MMDNSVGAFASPQVVNATRGHVMKRPQASSVQIEDFMSILVNIGAEVSHSNDSPAKHKITQANNQTPVDKPQADEAISCDPQATNASNAITIIDSKSSQIMISDNLTIANGQGEVGSIDVSSANSAQGSLEVSANALDEVLFQEISNENLDFASTQNVTGEVNAQSSIGNANIDKAAIAAFEAIGTSGQIESPLKEPLRQVPAQNSSNLSKPLSPPQPIGATSPDDTASAGIEQTSNSNTPVSQSSAVKTNQVDTKSIKDIAPRATEMVADTNIARDFEIVQNEEVQTAPEQTTQLSQNPRAIDTPALAATMFRKFHNGEKSFFIRLDPAELGTINIELKMGHDKKLRAIIAVEKPETLVELSNSIDKLSASLADTGMELAENGISFSLENSADQRNGFSGFAANENGNHNRGDKTASNEKENVAINAANENNDSCHAISPHTQVWKRTRVSLVA
jgi:hypothetical protein